MTSPAWVPRGQAGRPPVAQRLAVLPTRTVANGGDPSSALQVW
jgi:hypothetical protein